MKLTVTRLERPSHAKRPGLHYHICILMGVLSKHVSTLVQYLVRQTTHLMGRCRMSYRYVSLISSLSSAAGCLDLVVSVGTQRFL